MIKYVLSERRPGAGILPLGISCDESGVFIAGDVPLVARSQEAGGQVTYQARPPQTLAALLARAYGADTDFSAHIVGLSRVAQYMTEGKWVLAKIAAVQLRLSNAPNAVALRKASAVGTTSITKRCSCDRRKRSRRRLRRARKGDVSNEPRIPAGQSGGGEWTTDGDRTGQSSNPNIIPVQVEVLPAPGTIPLPFDLPAPDEITPVPFALPGQMLDPPLVNPYPNKRKCVEEWEEAQEFCAKMESEGKLVPGPAGRRSRGYSGFGKDYGSCVLGRVSEECGGSPTA